MEIAHGANRVYYVMEPLIDEIIEPKNKRLDAILKEPKVKDKKEREINKRIRQTLPKLKGKQYLFLPGLIGWKGIDYFNSTNQLAGQILNICKEYSIEDIIFIPISIVPIPFWYSNGNIVNEYLEFRYTNSFAKPLYEYSKSIFEEWETKWIFASAFKKIFEILDIDEVLFYGQRTSPERRVLEILEKEYKISDAYPMRNVKWSKAGLLEESSLRILKSTLRRLSGCSR